MSEVAAIIEPALEMPNSGSGGGGGEGSPENVFILEFMDGKLITVRRAPDGINGLARIGNPIQAGKDTVTK